MRITIANLKHSATLSEETHAFTATVLIDGVRAFEASNHGTGGPDSYHPVKGYAGPDAAAVDAWLRANTPKHSFHGRDLDNSLEIVVGDLVNDELRRRALKRMLSGKIVVIENDGEAGALYTYKGKPTPNALERMRQAIAGGRIKGRLVNGGDETVMAEALALV